MLAGTLNGRAARRGDPVQEPAKQMGTFIQTFAQSRNLRKICPVQEPAKHLSSPGTCEASESVHTNMCR